MNDASDKPSRPVSLGKPSQAAKTTSPGAKSGPNANPAPPGSRPRVVLLTAVAMVASGIAAIIASLALYGQHDFLVRNLTKSELKSKKQSNLTDKQTQDVLNQVHKIPSSQMIASVVLLIALGLVALAVWRGRYWARWAVIGLWVICSYTGTLSGLNSVFSISADLPGSFKVPTVIAGLLYLTALVLVMLPASGKFFALNKPARAEGAPARRGLFAPRVPADRAARPGAANRPARPGAKAALTSSAATRGQAHIERARAKTRASANAESIAIGAELARKRAKASKSRRTDV